ncbi:MAG: acyl-CoA thioesterase [Proteobacteria bacterium]|nr:acyl-CoA thioesterase [Pseudomonadota bacterium]
MADGKKKPHNRAPRKRSQQTPAPETTTAKAVPSPASAASGVASASHALAAIPVHVRWRDLDAFNHVNNSSYLTYLEEARLQWLRNVPGEWFTEHAMPVMAAVELHYRKPIEWPAEIDVLLSCERLGNSSMTLGNRIVDRDDHGRVYADGNVVMVWVDPTTGASVPLPGAIREICSV